MALGLSVLVKAVRMKFNHLHEDLDGFSFLLLVTIPNTRRFLSIKLVIQFYEFGQYC